jgi:hypothetical protein
MRRPQSLGELLTIITLPTTKIELMFERQSAMQKIVSKKRRARRKREEVNIA